MPFDLIALDLDGTLLNSREEISPRSRRAIRSALDAGIRIVLVTGRGVIWRGDPQRVPEAQAALVERARCNSDATKVLHSPLERLLA